MRPHNQSEPGAPAPSAWSMTLEVVGLAGVAVTQPLLDVFGNAPETFIEAGASRSDIVWFALAIAFVPALIVAAVQFAMARLASPAVRVLLHTVVIATFAALLAAHLVARGTAMTGAAIAAVAVASGAGFAWLRRRTGWISTWLRYLSVATPLFVALFLFASPVSELLAETSQAGVPSMGRADRGPVIVLVLDELPTRSLLASDGGIDADRFPGFGAFAAEGTWFRNATSVSSHTLSAVPAIFTGQYPTDTDGAPTAATYPENLFRLLERSYRFNVSEHITSLCAVARCDAADAANTPDAAHRQAALAVADQSDGLGALFPRAWRVYQTLLDGSDEEADPDAGHDGQFEEDLVDPVEGAATPQPALFARWLSNIDGDLERPQFSAIHIRLPHHPWFIGGDGVPYLVPGGTDRLLGLDERSWVDGAGLTTTTRQRHLLMVRYADTLVAALQSRLEALGIWDDATVIVTADHGAAFDPGGQFRYWDERNSPEIVGVPLFVHGPGFARDSIVDAPTQVVDVTPTIADVAGVESPWSFDGISLRALPDAARTRHPYALGATDDRRYRVTSIDVSDHLDRLLALAPPFGTDGGGDLAVLRSAPHGELIGRPLDAFTIGDTGGTVRQRFPESPGPDDDFAMNGHGRVPAYLFGTVAGGTGSGIDDGTPIVVALDERIAGVTTAYIGESGSLEYAVLLPPDWLADGTHHVRYFVLDETSTAAPRLLPLALAV